MVRYRVKPDQVAKTEALVRAVYDELKRTQATGIRYATFTLDDGLTFVHIASHENDGEGNPLAKVEAFKAFQQDIDERCAEPPVVTDLREVGSYRFFGE
jgi:quinol monooxygenase YgiN